MLYNTVSYQIMQIHANDGFALSMAHRETNKQTNINNEIIKS